MSSEKRSRSQGKALVRQLLGKRDMSWFEEKDYAWFARTLVPAIRTIGKKVGNKEERILAAEGNALLGDIYDVFMDAPRAALRAYRRCVGFDDQSAHGWREIGNMCGKVGDYRAAKRGWMRAIELDPSDNVTRVDLQYVEDDIATCPRALHPPGDAVCESADLIARLQPRVALRTLGRRASVEARKCRARAYEALGDHENALRQWVIIGRSSGDVEFTYADWFFLSDAVWNAPEFWEAMLAIGDRFGPGLYPKDDSFPEPMEKCREARRHSRPSLALQRRRWRLSARLHLARTRRDQGMLRRLRDKYPSWDLARKFAENAGAPP